MQDRRVALFLPSLGGGGAEKVALALAAALRARGHAVDLLLIRRVGELLPLVPEGTRVVELGGGRIAGSLPPLVRYVRRERPDALHAFMWPVTIVALLARKLARVPTRVVVSDHTTLSHHASSPRERRAMGITQGLFYPWADARIQVSDGAADDMARLSGISRHSIEVIPNPLSVPGEITTNDAVEALWGARRGPRILSIGSLKESKDHAALIRAFAFLDRPAAKMMIVGEGVMRPALEKLAADLQVADRVSLPGFALDPWRYYASADLFVLSSRLEGQPLVLVEAMLAGLPVVSTDCPHGPREVLGDGEFGRLVPVGDASALASAMDQALDAPHDAYRGRKRAEALSGSRSIERHLALLLD